MGIRFWSGWTTIVTLIALLLAVPVLFVLAGLVTDAGEIWQHLAATVLTRYVANSLWLMLGVGLGVLVLGTGTAWLVTMCQFPGQRIFAWALLLPFAAPAYILAYTYTELLEYYGPVQSQLRQLFHWESAQDYWFPNVRSLWGAILMLVLVLYPYVYLLARSAFLSQAVSLLEASRNLGCNPWNSFIQVALPLARPAIVAGLALALMETLNDYGTVYHFAVDTFTTGIYRTWFDLGEPRAAVQLAGVLLLFIVVLMGVERRSRGQSRYYQSSSRQQHLPRYSLGWIGAIGATVACLLPIALGFVVPAAILVQMTLQEPNQAFGERFWDCASHSLLLAGLTAGLAVGLALILAYGVRLRSNLAMQLAVQTAALGYAVPGSVIAVGVLVPIGLLDNTINAWMQTHQGFSTGLLLSGTIGALIYAYLIRFLAVSLGAVESGLSKIKPSLDDAARSLGHGSLSTLRQIHVPLLWSSLLTASILVFVDVMKELPATLIMRPFNFETLATQVYRLASDERLAEAAGPALAMVLVGLLPVLLLSRQLNRSG
ncbi:iron ABC transporter permease [Leptolyngbya sp. 'hensonii']|uniref:ABC transporter permease n=1 Tax=Leptolyngbya sp. 'hensonii' TaxID=1922337 RepID=UPI00094FFF50|nr:iron ABC transporter permease [Leptolyngbya sp. 'hensonii']OLP15729.1 iron ABC transporter permease [Leptolyngbya sp. 'hensonii']